VLKSCARNTGQIGQLQPRRANSTSLMPEAQNKMPIPWLKYDVGHSPQIHLDVFSSVTGTGMVFAYRRVMCAHTFLFYVVRASISLFAALEREKRTHDGRRV
jgi:hypothetical protein